jgi:hypothetical protein
MIQNAFVSSRSNRDSLFCKGWVKVAGAQLGTAMQPSVMNAPRYADFGDGLPLSVLGLRCRAASVRPSDMTAFTISNSAAIVPQSARFVSRAA